MQPADPVERKRGMEIRWAIQSPEPLNVQDGAADSGGSAVKEKLGSGFGQLERG